MTRPRPSRRGFTLVEAITATVVLAVLGSVTSGIIYSAVTNYTRASLSAQLHSEASVTLDRVVRELRMIRDDPGVPGAQPNILSVTDSAIEWGPGSALALAGGDLMLTENAGPARVLARDVTQFALAVFDENNAPIALPLAGAACQPIRRVEVTLTLARSGVSSTVRTKLFLRCTVTGA
jgi:prepilin-type N-terminal cleavage/methylation domain-containing protein